MRKNGATLTSITPPTGADMVGQWEDHIEDHQPYRSIFGADRTITDHEATVYTSVTQLADGTFEESEYGSSQIFVCQADRDCLPPLNVDQARELAAALLDCVAELEAWVQA